MPAQRFTSWGFRQHPLLQETAGTGGVALAITEQVPGSHQWQVDAISVWTTSSSIGPCRLYVASDESLTLPQFFRSGTAVGNSDTWEPGGSRLVVPAGLCLVFEWSGQSPGADCYAQVHYEDQAITLAGVDPSIKDWSG